MEYHKQVSINDVYLAILDNANLLRTELLRVNAENVVLRQKNAEKDDSKPSKE